MSSSSDFLEQLEQNASYILSKYNLEASQSSMKSTFSERSKKRVTFALSPSQELPKFHDRGDQGDFSVDNEAKYQIDTSDNNIEVIPESEVNHESTNSDAIDLQYKGIISDPIEAQLFSDLMEHSSENAKRTSERLHRSDNLSRSIGAGKNFNDCSFSQNSSPLLNSTFKSSQLSTSLSSFNLSKESNEDNKTLNNSDICLSQLKDDDTISNSPKEFNKQLKSYSPTSTGVVQTSADIVRNVLNTQITHKRFSNLDLHQAHHTHDLKQEDLGTNQFQKKSYQESFETTEEYINYLLSRLKSETKEGRLDAMNKISNLMSESFFSYDIHNEMAHTISSCLDNYLEHDLEFIEKALRIICILKGSSICCLSQLIQILKDPSMSCIYEDIIRSILFIGPEGLQVLINNASDVSTDWDSFVLTHIANNPTVQQNIIVPCLIQECQSSERNRRNNAVISLTKLGTLAKGALSTLLNIFINGSVDRKVVAVSIKCCGDEGVTRLIDLMLNHINPRIRESAAYGMGVDTSDIKPLKVLIISDFATVFSSPPKVIFNFEDPGEKYLQFDARQLVSLIRRGLTENIFEEMNNIDDTLGSNVSDFMIQVMEKRISKNGSHSSFQSRGTICNNSSFYNQSQEDQSMNMILSSLNQKFALQARKTHDILQTSGKKEEIASKLISALNDPDESVRIAAAISLGTIGSTSSINPLSNLLRDSSNWVRASAVSSLGAILSNSNTKAYNTQFFELLKKVTPLLKDSHYNVRFSAVKAIKKLGERANNDKGLIEHIVTLLSKMMTEGSINRNEVAETLVGVGDKGISKLISLLRNEAGCNAKVRVSCAVGLSLIDMGSPMLDPVIENLFFSSKDSSPQVRKAVIRTLGVLSKKSKEKVAYLTNRSFLPFLYNFLKDKEKVVREAAAQLLAESGSHGELLLIEALLKDLNPLIRATAAYGLMFVGARAIRTLLLALNDKEQLVIKSVSNSIETIGAEAIADTMKRRSAKQRESVIFSINELQSSPFFSRTPLEKILSSVKEKLEFFNKTA